MTIQRIRIDEVNVGERSRKDMGDIPAFAKKIKDVGLLQPIVVKKINSGYQLIAGERRFRAMRHNGESMVYANIIDPKSRLDELIAERDENDERKEPTISEKVALGKRIEDELGERRGRPEKTAPNGANIAPHPGKNAEIAAELAGFSGETDYRRAKEIVANGTPQLIAAVDEGVVSKADAAAIAGEPDKVQNAAVKKVKSGKAKTAKAAVSEAKKVSDADESAKPQLDCMKKPVPESIRDVFEQVEEFRSIMHVLAGCKSRVNELCKHQAGGWIDKQDTDRMIQQAHAHLRFAMPYTECPKCRRKPQKKCPHCKGTGWINESMFGSCASDDDKAWLKGDRS